MYRVTVAAVMLILPLGLLHSQELPLKDPMRPYRPAGPAGTVVSAPARFELSAVLISSERRVAVINGTLYREGDRVNDAQITRIELESVVLRQGSEDMVVRLNSGRLNVRISQGDSAS